MAINKDPGDSRTPIFSAIDFDPDISEGGALQDWPFRSITDKLYGGALISSILNRGQYDFEVLGSGLGLGSAKIACVGDGLTFGISNGIRVSTPWPARLADLFVGGPIISNYGKTGKMMSAGFDTLNYKLTSEHEDARSFDADVYIIAFGTIDAQYWNTLQTASGRTTRYVYEDYEEDCQIMFNAYNTAGNRIYFMTIPYSHWWGTTNTNILEANVIIEAVACNNGCGIIDCYTDFNIHGPLDAIPWYHITDQQHLVQAGYTEMGNRVFDRILPDIVTTIDKGNKILRPGLAIKRIDLTDIVATGGYTMKIIEYSSAIEKTTAFNVDRL